MGKIIRLTETQYNLLNEDFDSGFNYIGDSDVPHNDGQVNITANGKLNGDENGNPVTSDKVEKMVTPQQYYNFVTFGRSSLGTRAHVTENLNDKDNDGIDDFYNSEELDTLSDGDNNDDLVKVPEGVIVKTKLLSDEIKKAKLNPKQQAMVLNKIIEDCAIGSVPYAWKKELMMKLLKK